MSTNSIFAGSISATTTTEVLQELFSLAGPIEKIIHNTGSSKVYCLVYYVHPLSAEYAIAAFNGLVLDGRMLSVKRRNDFDPKTISKRTIVPNTLKISCKRDKERAELICQKLSPHFFESRNSKLPNFFRDCHILIETVVELPEMVQLNVDAKEIEFLVIQRYFDNIELDLYHKQIVFNANHMNTEVHTRENIRENVRENVRENIRENNWGNERKRDRRSFENDEMVRQRDRKNWESRNFPSNEPYDTMDRGMMKETFIQSKNEIDSNWQNSAKKFRKNHSNELQTHNSHNFRTRPTFHQYQQHQQPYQRTLGGFPPQNNQQNADRQFQRNFGSVSSHHNQTQQMGYQPNQPNQSTQSTIPYRSLNNRQYYDRDNRENRERDNRDSQYGYYQQSLQQQQAQLQQQQQQGRDGNTRQQYYSNQNRYY